MGNTITFLKVLQHFWDRHRAFPDVYHEPGVRVACSADSFRKIVPSLFAVTDDMFAGTNLDADSDTRVFF